MELLQYINLMINKHLSQGGGIDEQCSGGLTRYSMQRAPQESDILSCGNVLTSTLCGTYDGNISIVPIDGWILCSNAKLYCSLVCFG